MGGDSGEDWEMEVGEAVGGEWEGGRVDGVGGEESCRGRGRWRCKIRIGTFNLCRMPNGNAGALEYYVTPLYTFVRIWQRI